MQQDIYTGIRELVLTDNEIAKVYENMDITLEQPLLNNEYIIIYDEEKNIVDKFRWNGEKLVKLKYKAINNSIFGKVKSLNIYQDCIFDMVYDNSITIKSSLGIPGGGKSYIAVVAAIDFVLKGQFNKLIYVKNNVDIAHEKIGAIPGTLNDKLEPWQKVLYDIGNKFVIDNLKAENKLEVEYLGHTVGRTFDNSFVVIDDAQQLSKEHVYNLTTRLGHNSVMYFAADLFQTYSNKYKNGNNGLRFLHDKLKGQEFFACVHTKISERSHTAQRCAELLFEGLID